MYLDGLLVVLVDGAPDGCILPMDSTQEVQLDSVLGHPVLELVKELTTAGQAQTPLIQLDIRQTFNTENKSFCCTIMAETNLKKSWEEKS